jgi:hypothetical protein
VFRDNGVDVATYELCLFAELRDRVRAGDIWWSKVDNNQAVEDQLIPKVATMKIAEPCRSGSPAALLSTCRERRTLLEAPEGGRWPRRLEPLSLARP